MSKLNEFGVYLKPGKNMKTFSEGREYFKQVHDIDIIKYKFTLENPRRRKLTVKQKDLSNCEICGKKLYRFLTATEVHDPAAEFLDDTEGLYVEHKRHLVFYDIANKAHKTCYKMNACFQRIDFTPGPEYTKKSIEPLSAENFLGFQPSNKDEEVFFESYSHNYNTFVIPFVVKWANSFISKKNILLFQKDFLEIKLKHLPYYEDERAKKNALNKILSMIGIENE